MFSPTVTPGTFMVCYYRGSLRLQHFKSQIEKGAQYEVDKKITELEKANACHTELRQQISQTEHSYSTDCHGYRFYSGDCRKCDLKDQQKGMMITIHEWPLLAKQLQAEVVISKLDCPISFNMWHTATCHLLFDLGMSEVSHPVPHTPKITPGKYNPLKPYLVSHTSGK